MKWILLATTTPAAQIDFPMASTPPPIPSTLMISLPTQSRCRIYLFRMILCLRHLWAARKKISRLIDMNHTH